MSASPFSQLQQAAGGGSLDPPSVSPDGMGGGGPLIATRRGQLLADELYGQQRSADAGEADMASSASPASPDEDSEREAWRQEREQRLALLASGQQQAESDLAVSARKGKEALDEKMAALNFSFGAPSRRRAESKAEEMRLRGAFEEEAAAVEKLRTSGSVDGSPAAAAGAGRTSSQDGRIRTRSFPKALLEHAASGHAVTASPGRTTWTAQARLHEQTASPDGTGGTGDAMRLMEAANAAAAQQLKADMREFVLGHPRAGLADWARESVWARDTGGDVSEGGASVRVLGGVWEDLWQQIQSEEQPILRRLREGVAALEARDAALAECEELKQHLASQAERRQAERTQAQKMQARLHTVMQAREDEQGRDRGRAEVQTLQLAEARSAAATAARECEQLRSALGAEKAEVARLREVLSYHSKEQQDERDAALRSRSKLRAEVHAERVRGIEGRAEVAASLVLGSNHWQRECEKMCNLLGQAEERAEFFETRTKCLLRAADIGGAGVVNVSTQAISCCLW